MAVLLQAFTRS